MVVIFKAELLHHTSNHCELALKDIERNANPWPVRTGEDVDTNSRADLIDVAMRYLYRICTLER